MDITRNVELISFKLFLKIFLQNLNMFSLPRESVTRWYFVESPKIESVPFVRYFWYECWWLAVFLWRKLKKIILLAFLKSHTVGTYTTNSENPYSKRLRETCFCSVTPKIVPKAACDSVSCPKRVMSNWRKLIAKDCRAGTEIFMRILKAKHNSKQKP